MRIHYVANERKKSTDILQLHYITLLGAKDGAVGLRDG